MSALSLRESIQKLQNYTDSSAPILSVYLDATLPSKELVKNFDHLIEKSLVMRDKILLADNILITRGYLESYHRKHGNQSLAIFSGGDNLFEVISTDFTITPLVSVSHSPYLDPLYEELEEYETYLVIVADKEHAKCFTLHDDQLAFELPLLSDDVPQKMKGRSFEERQDIIDRHIRKLLIKHFEHVADEARHLGEPEEFAGVIIGSHDQLFKDIEEALPKELREKVVGHFNAKASAPFNELLEKSQEIIRTLDKATQKGVSTTITV